MKSLLLKVLPLVLAVVVLQFVAIADSQAAPPAWGCNSGGDGTYYVVCYGDTLFSIGRQFGVNPFYIAQVNGIANPNFIYAGQVLYIPASDGGCGVPCQPVGCNWPCSPPRPAPPSNCGQNCGPMPIQPFGYDQTGYWYGGFNPQYTQYSYTCGYNYNCY